MHEFQHFLLTRFNVRMQWLDDHAPSVEWLRRRFALFERFCYPSVCSQTCQAFVWLVFFDTHTPDEFRERVAAYEQHPAFQAVFVDHLDSAVVQEAVRNRLAKDTPYVITSRLDNDDAICKDYIGIVQRAFAKQTAEFINFRYGYIWYDGRVYQHEWPTGPFLSLTELSRNLRTVLCGNHNHVAQIAPVQQVTDCRGYTMVVHGENIANRFPTHCMRSRLGGARREFPIEAFAGEETLWEVVAENISSVLGRCSRKALSRLAAWYKASRQRE
jgi:hypothetical protein